MSASKTRRDQGELHEGLIGSNDFVDRPAEYTHESFTDSAVSAFNIRSMKLQTAVSEEVA